MSTTHAINLDVQSAINIQILDQLSKIGKRLDKIESKENQTCKKTSDKAKVKSSKSKSVMQNKDSAHTLTDSATQNLVDTTSLQALRQDAYIQAQVETRIQELAQMSKAGNIKSQRGGKVDVMVKHRVKWPHEYILTGINKERINYDQLSVTQWVAGFGRTIREESDAEMQNTC